VFGKLKAIFTTEPILAILDINKKTRVKADASNYAIGGVLSTKCKDVKASGLYFKIIKCHREIMKSITKKC